jgi:hypothetical protein
MRAIFAILASVIFAVVVAQTDPTVPGAAPAQCPIFRFTSNVVAGGDGAWQIQFNAQTSKRLDFVIVHYRSNPAGDWINQRMTSISNTEWSWPLDIDLFTGDTMQYWFTYCAERVDCDSPQFEFTVPQPPEPSTAPPETTTTPYQAPMGQPMASPLAPAFVENGRGYGAKQGRGHGGYGGVEATAIPYAVGPSTVYQSAPVAQPEYTSSYGAYGRAQAHGAYGRAQASVPAAAPYQAPASAPYQAPLAAGSPTAIIPSGEFADGGHGGGYGRGGRGHGSYPVIGSQPTFSASAYGGAQAPAEAPAQAASYQAPMQAPAGGPY